MATQLKHGIAAGLMGLALLLSGPVLADRDHNYGRGHAYANGYERGHSHGNGWAWGVGGLVAGALIADTLVNRQPVVSYQPAPVYVASPPVVYSEPVYYEAERVYVPQRQPQVTNNWYYCQRPQGYYPYVQECYSGWMAIPPRPGR